MNFSVTEWEGDTLELTRISRLDMGAYLCIASNGVPPTVSKRIKVSVDCEYNFYVFFHSTIKINKALHQKCNYVYTLFFSPS